jgi:hypothetical protein
LGVGALGDLAALFDKPETEQDPGKRLLGLDGAAVMAKLDGAMGAPTPPS